VRPASHLDYKGYDVHSAPSPTNGGLVVLETLGLLEQRFPIGDAGAGYAFGTRHTIHAMVESLRLAFADRDTWIGDPAAFAVPEAQLLSDAYLQERAARLNPFPVRMTPNTAVPPGDPLVEGSGHTTHFSIVDRFGNVVSFTTTLRDSFGSGIMVGPYGFVLNNSLSLFNIPARVAPDPGANNAGPSKRPMGSQTPVVVVKGGEPVAATGTYGAEFIPSLVLNIVLDVIDHGLPLQQAVDSSRLWSRASTGVYAWAPPVRDGRPFPLEEIVALRELGPPRPALNPPAGDRVFGSLASVGVDAGTLALVGASDDIRQPDARAVVVQR
jgi:gamma-glutamyltranspeptidase/glutathione hydrolase